MMRMIFAGIGVMLATALLAATVVHAEVWQFFSGHSAAMTTSTAIANSTEFNAQTRVLRLFAEEEAFVAWGSTNGSNPQLDSQARFLPFASNTTGYPVPANTEVFLAIPGGGFLAVRASSTAGPIFIQELSK
jgi:uncharacterized protein YigE (DUF2233 family)